MFGYASSINISPLTGLESLVDPHGGIDIIGNSELFSLDSSLRWNDTGDSCPNSETSDNV